MAVKCHGVVYSYHLRNNIEGVNFTYSKNFDECMKIPEKMGAETAQDTFSNASQTPSLTSVEFPENTRL